MTPLRAGPAISRLESAEWRPLLRGRVEQRRRLARASAARCAPCRGVPRPHALRSAASGRSPLCPEPWLLKSICSVTWHVPASVFSIAENQHNLRWNIGYAPQAKSAFDQGICPAVNEAVMAGHGVLFHCGKGRHRSALAAAVALMVGLGCQFHKAYSCQDLLARH